MPMTRRTPSSFRIVAEPADQSATANRDNERVHTPRSSAAERSRAAPDMISGCRTAHELEATLGSERVAERRAISA